MSTYAPSSYTQAVTAEELAERAGLGEIALRNRGRGAAAPDRPALDGSMWALLGAEAAA